jgi:hypothetical protein
MYMYSYSVQHCYYVGVSLHLTLHYITARVVWFNVG